MRAAVQIFNTGWLDAAKAILIGVLIGLVLRIRGVRNYVEGIPFGVLLTGVGLGVIGLGSIGVFGAAILYLRFEDIELIRLPLHASVVGLSAFIIYLASKWGRSEEI